MINEFKNNNIDYTFYDAIDGLTYEQTKNDKIYLQNIEYNKQIRTGTIACMLSHIRILEYFKKTNNECIVVCEDDIKLNSDYKTVLSNLYDMIINDIEKYSMINLCSEINDTWPNDFKIEMDITDEFKIYHSKDVWCEQGARCYLVTKKGCNDILKNLIQLL